jgi:hypothetical protein
MSDLQIPDQSSGSGALPPLVLYESPFWPRHLVDLFVRPTRFFSSQLAIGRPAYAAIVAWALGISSAIDQIDTRLLRAEAGSPSASQTLVQVVAEDWLAFWAFVAISGMFGAGLAWYVGGWWCKVRLRWCGVASPDTRLARLLLVYSSFVFAAPHVLAVLAQNLQHANYREAFEHDVWPGLGAMVVWSMATTYKGAMALFNPKKWLAVLWFIVLPALFYLAIGGGLGLFLADDG